MIHHIDDFDVCGPAEAVKHWLENQIPICLKLKVGELEGMEGETGTSSESSAQESKPLMVVW